MITIAAIYLALSMRVRVGPQRFHTPPLGIALVFVGFWWLGTSFVLVLRSPFRMSPPERAFRLVWLGPVGRAAVRLSMGRKADRAPRGPAPRRADVPVSLAALEARVMELERWRARSAAGD